MMRIMPKNESQRVLAELLQETAEDLVGLWLLEKWVQRAAGAKLDAQGVRAATLAIVDDAIESGEVVAGSFVGDDFQPWSLDKAGVRRRIESIWCDGSRELSPTDNVWLSGCDLNYRTLR
jgi:hypothetical protein